MRSSQDWYNVDAADADHRDTDDTMMAALGAVERAGTREPGVLGIHFEGPFLSPKKAGVHRPDWCRRPEPHHRRMLAGHHKGVLLVTLAPEQTPPGFIAELAAAGVKVSLGHSMATYQQTRAAMAEGLTGFTHLFNAMRPLSSREPGPIAAALESPSAFYGLIVDGEHVAPAMLRLALRAGTGHPMLVTDAMPPVGGCKQEFALQDQQITVRDGRCTTGQGTLAGSAMDMASAVRNCVRLLQLPLDQALAFASTEPAKFLGIVRILSNRVHAVIRGLDRLDPRIQQRSQTSGLSMTGSSPALTALRHMGNLPVQFRT